MTSELSNALNPNIAHSRSRPRNHSTYPTPVAEPQPQQSPQLVPQYVPHRSELEGAIAEPSYVRPPPLPVPPPTPSSLDDNALAQILRVLAENRAEAEKEKQRHIAWEKEQEAKYAAQRRDFEEQLTRMREELALVKGSVTAPSPTPSQFHPSAPPSGPITPVSSVPDTHLPPRGIYASPSVPIVPTPTPRSAPLTPVSQHALPPPPPQFIEGSSRYPYGSHTPSTPQSSVFLTPQLSHIPSVSNTPSPMLMAAPSPVMPVMHAPVPHALAPPSSAALSLGKRTTPPSPDSGNGSGDDSDDGNDPDPNGLLPRKRLNGHDKRCLTIQHAMRAHFLKTMKIQSDKDLPESHVEGVFLPDTAPIRFVWEKTTKQSSHNAAMKKRFLADIKAKQKRSYKYVPDRDFAQKTLDSAYEQAYTTLRQKYKAQKDAVIARNLRIKEDQKALKARRNARKKAKLIIRGEARQRLPVFSHATFNGALQPECMSSEESCDEYSDTSLPPGADPSVQVLRIRGLSWRSSRLTRLYSHLDEDEKVDRSLKAKRPQPRRERCLGPPKDGFHLPPKGVSSWMISQRWVREAREAHPDLVEILKGLVVDPPGFNWGEFDLLGLDSEDELESHGHVEIPRSEISYSLAHALAPM
ncbi:hypothetical protein EIP91_001519 [Steccherinum ochraceum]|uniref:Uncharacterized protein n=1 Tax=Steccherinum ochraceum TaxID=92696 RepID=A0A4R0RXN6_9APHY|nr:hypothetical protein EIP91_001519 [Steccherinum ochraceum]